MTKIDVHATQLIDTATEARDAVLSAQRAGDSIGFVPTMGALHAGHLSLVEASLAAHDRTVVSIFVNPTQFGSGEDLEHYPRPINQDVRMLEVCGCWMVFAPLFEEMYGENCQTTVEVGHVAEPLEGVARPQHFRGVATVVLKLLQIVPADCIFFGQKDYQQTLVVRQLVRDLDVPTDIQICPTVREPSGLAISSRNAYLSAAERTQAAILWQALLRAEKMRSEGASDVSAIEAEMRRILKSAGVHVEYIAFLEDGTVREVSTIDGPTVVALAARVGQTRLIDNHNLG